jgi:hypothetical protein
MLVAKRVPNGSVANLLRESALPVSWQLRINIARQIAIAMAFLHRKGLIHRYVGSWNLAMLFPQGLKRHQVRECVAHRTRSQTRRLWFRTKIEPL